MMKGLKKLKLLWMKLGGLVQAVTQPLILAALYFLVITPVGLVRRSLGYSKINLDRDTQGCWRKVNTDPAQPESLKRMF